MAVIPTHNGKRVYENYKPKTHPKDWDIIVIGSGIGGMSCAAALAKVGKKVLVLEQHYIPGGYTHSYARKGYQWDAGVHAIGGMREGQTPKRMLDWLSNGKMEMISLGDPYDSFRMPDDFEIGFPDNAKDFQADIKAKFPEQAEKIDTYFDYVKKASKASFSVFALRTQPKWVAKFGGAINNLRGRNWFKPTVTEIFDEIVIEGKLRTVLSVHWGYIGTIPDEASFAMHALVHTHFWSGAYYPKGGSKEFAGTFLGNVVDNKGLVLCKASVEDVLIENGKTKGVRMREGEEFFAPVVVSAAGAKNTVNKLVPQKYKQTSWGRTINSIGDTPPYICLNMGFKGDIRKAGASSANEWLYGTWDNNAYYWDINDKDAIPHILYISFPSLKDPEHDAGKEEKHTGECVTFISWETVQKWQDTQEADRPQDYEEFKRNLEQRMIDVMKERIPNIMEYLDYYELSTPLTSAFYTRAEKGAIYGLLATPERFNNDELRTRTPIRNLFMTGVDIGSIGVVGGMSAGLMTAESIEKGIFKKALKGNV